MSSHEATCEHCGQAFEVVYPQNPNRFCSQACHYAHRRRLVARECGSCGTPMEVQPSAIKNGGGKFCSPRCAGASYRSEPNRECEVCGAAFYAKPYLIRRGQGRFCSIQCLGVAQRGEGAPRWKGGWSVDYRRTAPGQHSDRDLRRLFHHQRGCCPYCQADLNETGYQRDHIIPLVKGGTDFIGNIQLTCPGCNRRKWDKLPIVFRLEIGAVQARRAVA